MVLFISRSKKTATTAASLFRKLQIVSYGATPTEALTEISPIYHAAVIMDPEELPDHKDFIKRLRAYERDIPIFALTDRPDLLPSPELFGVVESNGVGSADFACKIIEYLISHSKKPVGAYRLAGFESLCDRPYTSFYDIRMPFTKTEAMIIRYLICAHPTPSDAKTILKYAFPPSDKPEPSTVRTHVYSINKKFSSMFPSIDFIIHIPKEGYKIKLGTQP